MAGLNMDALLEPVQIGAPCGPNLEYSPEQFALTSAAAEPEESAIKGIETVDARNWRDLRSRAEKLLAQSKHLGVAGILARSLLQTEGVVAYCQAIALVRKLCEQYWAELHPLPEDGDVVSRLNALAELWSPPLLAALRATPVVSVRGIGDFSVRDVLVTRGKEKPRPGVAPPSPQLVQRALDSAPDVAATAAAVQQALADLAALRALVAQHAPGESFDPSPLDGVLGTLRDALPKSAPQPSDSPTNGAAQGEHGVTAGSQVHREEPAMNSPQVVYRERELESREDVVLLLDRICAYYEKHEPSSPIPLLLQRARRLVTMNFMELIKELADKGIPQIEAITGKEPKT